METRIFTILLTTLFLLTGSCIEVSADSENTTYEFWCSDGTVPAAVWYNSKVAILIEGETISQRDNTRMETFLQMMTNLYSKYEELTGLTNLPKDNDWLGRIAIQIPIDNCGAAGLASHGVLGLSVGKSLFDEEQYDRIDDNVLQQVFFYEAHRNFWPEEFNDKFDWAMNNDPDSWGWWTVGMNNAMVSIVAPLIGVNGMYGSQTAEQFRDGMVEELQTCINNGYTWDTGWTSSLMPWNPTESINDLMSGLLIYSYETWGRGDWLSGFYEGIQSTTIPDRTDVFAYQECRDNVYKIWSVAAGQNLSAFFESTLQWTLSSSAKTWVTGQVGAGSVTTAGESFLYANNANIDNGIGGSGWTSPWNLAASNGTTLVKSGSLSYNGVTSSGGKLQLVPSSDTPAVELERNVNPMSSGTVWMSYLMKANTLGTGHIFIRPNGNQNYAIGKSWGNGFSIDNQSAGSSMSSGATYLLVAKIVLQAGNDSIYMWVNPSTSAEPSTGSAGTSKANIDLGILTKIDINLQGYGSGDYELDEIRVNGSYAEAIGGGILITPQLPGGLSAMTVSSSAIDLGWTDNSSNETGFKIERKSAGSFSEIATVAAGVTTYRNSGLNAGTTYTYRVRAYNAGGNSGYSNEQGATTGGTSSSGLVAGESFSYSNNTNIHGITGGSGWSGAWNLSVSNGTALAKSGSLSYIGVASSGGKLQLDPSTDTPEVILERNIGAISTGTVWLAYLVKANALGNGHLFMRPNGSQSYAIGKRWGNEFAIDNLVTGSTMSLGTTYLLVAKVELQSGNDNIYMWVNPSLSGEPSIGTADASKSNVDLGNLTKVDVVLQGYGAGDYEVDEIRVGHTFADVTGSVVGPLTSAKNIILWISAHPDDELFGAHAAFARYVKEHGQIGHYINVTSGSVQYNPSTTINYEHGMERMGEAFASANSVGADNRFMGMIDGQVSPDIETLQERLTRAIREIQPDIIITHGPEGEYGNPDHVATSAAVTAAVTSAALSGSYPDQLTAGLKVWHTPKFYRIKYDEYPNDDPLTLNVTADEYSAVLGKSYYQYADETLRASHVTAENAGIFDTYPVPHYTKGYLYYEREDISVSFPETDLLSGLSTTVERPVYIQDWVVIGSWSGDLSSDVLGISESSVSNPLGLTHGGETWTAYNDRGHSLVDFRNTFAPNANAVAYAYTEISSALAMTTYLRIAASSKYKVWLNGTVVRTENSIPAYDYEEHVPVTLASGVNRILVKTEVGGTYAGVARPWGFFLKVGSGADSPPPVPDGEGHITVLPTEESYNMGEATVGGGNQNTVQFVIQNIDLADNLSISNVSLTGTHSGDYVIHNDSGQGVLVPGGKRTFDVSFNPSSEGPLARTANITINSDDEDKPAVSIYIFGDALGGIIARMSSAGTEDESVHIYPNAVDKLLTVDLKDLRKESDHAPAMISITDMAGETRYVNRDVNQETVVDMSAFSKGIYLIRINTGSRIITKRIIKLN